MILDILHSIEWCFRNPIPPRKISIQQLNFIIQFNVGNTTRMVIYPFGIVVVLLKYVNGIHIRITFRYHGNIAAC